MTIAAAPPVVREATSTDRLAARGLLTGAGLPVDGLDDAAAVLVADAGGEVVGAVALERHGHGGEPVFLLRSAVVDPSWRNRRLGAALTAAALQRVDAVGAPVALLTETAGEYFPRFGFRPVTRDELPPALAASAELRGASPVSAQAMLRKPA